jgi:hypothetical protein
LRLRLRRERIDLGRVDAAESRDLHACAAKLALFHLSPLQLPPDGVVYD